MAPASILITGPLVMTIHTCSALHDEWCNKSASAGHENTIMIQIYFHLMSSGLLLVICPRRRLGPGRSPIVSSSHQKSVGHRSQGSLLQPPHSTSFPMPRAIAATVARVVQAAACWVSHRGEEPRHHTSSSSGRAMTRHCHLQPGEALCLQIKLQDGIGNHFTLVYVK